MSDSKPLTKERREEIAKEIAAYCEDRGCDELLAAEQFWREAVKKVERVKYGALTFCVFCYADDSVIVNRHKPDCPWVLAQ